MRSTYTPQSVHAHRHSMRSESCVAMEWTTLRCGLYSAPSSSPSCSMHRVHDGDSLRPQSDIALAHSSVVVHAVDLYHLTCRRLKLSAAQLTKNCLRTILRTASMFYIDSCRYHRMRRKTTISARVATTLNFRVASVILLTATLLRECCTQTFTSNSVILTI